MKKEWFLIVASVALTVIIALTLFRWFAPQLLGLPVDLQMVRVAKEVSPFFDSVFRLEDHEGQNYIIPDPYIVRAKPLLPSFYNMGPNDILGFRNRNIPNIADIITIGDSQTYGNNVFLEQNWPNRMLESMKYHTPILYNMSVGGWGAAEYFEILDKALFLQPRVVIIAFYTGNDALDTFMKIYSDQRWNSLRLNPAIKASDAPKLQKSLSESSNWKVKFNDGTETVFSPEYRHLSNNRKHPAVLVGYEIMGKIAQKMGKIAEKIQIKLVFTIIPTKELVFKEKIKIENIEPRKDYTALVNDEEKNLTAFAEELQKIPGSVYVDLLEPLQHAVVKSQYLYPSWDNGHPVAGGYKLIGDILYKEVVKLLPDKLRGGIVAKILEDEYKLLLVKNDYYYEFVTKKIANENGWTLENMTKATLRDISKLHYGGTIKTVDPSLFGPKAF